MFGDTGLGQRAHWVVHHPPSSSEGRMSKRYFEGGRQNYSRKPLPFPHLQLALWCMHFATNSVAFLCRSRKQCRKYARKAVLVVAFSHPRFCPPKSCHGNILPTFMFVASHCNLCAVVRPRPMHWMFKHECAMSTPKKNRFARGRIFERCAITGAEYT